ncbi:hypothetical protein [Polaribacter sp. R77954]|uniref:hypothetical protein n=1 Tax=Polaribacter sp. R77954 TaxID=3093870 RepID=UPI0037C8555E
MEITKEHIQIIDNHLKKNGIKYWDLRVEMIDHLVSDIEQNYNNSDFETELYASLKRMNWNGYISGVNREGWQNVNRKYRSEYHKGFLNFFKSFINVAILMLSLFGLFLISENVSINVFNKISFLLFAAPLIITLVLFAKLFFKKYGRSVNLDYGVMYMTLSFFILNVVPVFLDGQSELVRKIMWFIILPIHYAAFYSGYNLYKKAIAKVDFMKKELTS